MIGKLGDVEPLIGTFEGETLRGYDAYTIAVMHGFEGTIEEWLASLKGEPGSLDGLDEYMKPMTSSDIESLFD